MRDLVAVKRNAPKWDARMEEMQCLRESGLTLRAIAAHYGVTEVAVRNAWAKFFRKARHPKYRTDPRFAYFRELQE